MKTSTKTLETKMIELLARLEATTEAIQTATGDELVRLVRLWLADFGAIRTGAV